MVARGQLEAIAGSVNGFDEPWFAGIWLEFGAQVADVNTDGFDVVVWFITPHLLEDQRGGNRLTMALQQAMEKFKFKVGKPHRLFKPNRFEAFWHQGDRSEIEYFVVLA